MISKDYKKNILELLLKKYNRRYAKKVETNRKIIIKPSELYRDYDKNNADILEKQALREATSALENKGLITVAYLKFSDDIDKIYLLEEHLDMLYECMQDEYGVISRDTICRQVHEIAEKYVNAGEITRKYRENILQQLENPGYLPEPARIKNNLKMFDFLENNKSDLYVREASMLVYGDSKWFENNNYEEVCSFIRNVMGKIKEEGERNDAILNIFHITSVEQEIFIKGNWMIECDQYSLDVSKFKGGIAIASGDLKNIKNIIVNTEDVLTVENKTSFQRMTDVRFSMMYLGGYANRQQIEFLKKVISDNPGIGYYHFGDIDIGGFLIHRHLCRQTSKKFEFYCMGIQQLSDKRFRNCLRELTDNDIIRLESLIKEELYGDVLRYMKEHNVKLEQEIVSYYLENT